MMRKVFILIFILVFIMSPWEIRGQQLATSSSPSISEIPAILSLLFNRILVYLREGGAFTGLLVGIESNSLIVRIGKKDEKIPFQNLAKVIIETEKKTSRNVLYFMLIGTYLQNLSRRAKNQPTAYMQHTYGEARSLLLINILSAGLWGGLGYLASSIFEKNEKVFDFTGSEEKRYSKWEQLRRYITGEYHPKKFHLSIQAGHVYMRISNRYSTLLQNAGYDIRGYSYMFDDYKEEATNFNLLRKLQFTYSRKPEAEIGFAILWLGEPSTSGSKYKWNEMNQSSRVEQVLYATGYYIVGIYKQFLRGMQKRIAWNIGFGVGAAKIDFRLKAHSETWDPNYWDPNYWDSHTEVTYEHNISKTLFSGVFFTELNFYLQDTLSLGLAADYVYVPTENVPAIPEADIPAQKLRLGNISVGFSLGLHF